MSASIKTFIAQTASKLVPRLWADFDIARRNKHFEPEFWLLPQLCQGAETVVDVGGNQGLFAYYMAKSARQVHVFEPNPICLAQMRRLSRRNITVHSVALSAEPGKLTLRFDPANTGIGTIEAGNRLDRNEGIRNIVERQVDVCRLDDFGLSGVDFIKIDVEGHEAAVVSGGLNTIGATRPILLIESELRHNPAAFGLLEQMLQPFGYTAWYQSEGRFSRAENADLPRLQQVGEAYINNFLFVPPTRLTTFEALLA
jgi:FkbM family methyltransferase